jgi:hypothetical protein
MLYRKLYGERQLGRPRHRWEKNIKINVIKITEVLTELNLRPLFNMVTNVYVISCGITRAVIAQSV